MTAPGVDQFRNFLRTVMTEYLLPGASLAIVYKGEVILVEGFGVTDLKTNTPVNERTQFGIGSITKGFTAALLAAIIPQHGITWDTPLSKIFEDIHPSFHFADNYMTQNACLRDLLAHKMGIELGASDLAWMCHGFDRRMLSNAHHIPLSHAGFRAKFTYNNITYSLAANVVEVLTGSSWEERIRERFFNLLGMEDASFLNEEPDDSPNIAKPHMLIKNTPVEISMEFNRASECIGPGGSICCSAQDMAKWMQFLLDNGKLFGTAIIPTTQLLECWKSQSVTADVEFRVSQPEFPVTQTTETYGFGFERGTYRGYKTISHAGVMFGYNSQMTLYPAMNLGIYTAFNGHGDENEQGFLGCQLMHYFISDCMLGLSQWLTVSHIKSFPEPWMPREKCFIPRIHTDIIRGIQPTRPLVEYVGTYTHGFLSDISINIDITIAVLNMYHGKYGQFKLHPSGEIDEFRIEGTGVMSCLHQLDIYSPSDWMMVKFCSMNSANVDSLLISFYESNPIFKKSNLIMS